MVRQVLLASLLLAGGLAGSAATSGEALTPIIPSGLQASEDSAALNAVCVETNSGERTFVLFSEAPVISAEDGKLVVNTAQDSLVTVGDLFNVKEITAVHWDKPTGIHGAGYGGWDGPVEFYTLDGRRVDYPQKGQIYIIRQGNKSKKIINK